MTQNGSKWMDSARKKKEGRDGCCAKARWMVRKSEMGWCANAGEMCGAKARCVGRKGEMGVLKWVVQEGEMDGGNATCVVRKGEMGWCANAR